MQNKNNLQQSLKLFHKKALKPQELSQERNNLHLKQIISPQQQQIPILQQSIQQNRSITPIRRTTVFTSPLPQTFLNSPNIQNLQSNTFNKTERYISPSHSKFIQNLSVRNNNRSQNNLSITNISSTNNISFTHQQQPQPQKIQVQLHKQPLNPQQQHQQYQQSIIKRSESVPKKLSLNTQKIQFITQNTPSGQNGNISIPLKSNFKRQGTKNNSIQLSKQNSFQKQKLSSPEYQIINVSLRKPKNKQNQNQQQTAQIIEVKPFQPIPKKTQKKSIVLVQDQINPISQNPSIMSNNSFRQENQTNIFVQQTRKKSDEVNDLVMKIESKIHDLEKQKGNKCSIVYTNDINNKYINGNLYRISENELSSQNFVTSQQQLSQKKQYPSQQDAIYQKAQQSPYQIASPLTSPRIERSEYKNNSNKDLDKQQFSLEKDQQQKVALKLQEIEQENKIIDSIQKKPQYNRHNNQNQQQQPENQQKIQSYNFNVSGNKFPKMQPIDSIELEQNKINSRQQSIIELLQQQQHQQQEEQQYYPLNSDRSNYQKQNNYYYQAQQQHLQQPMQQQQDLPDQKQQENLQPEENQQQEENLIISETEKRIKKQVEEKIENQLKQIQTENSLPQSPPKQNQQQFYNLHNNNHESPTISQKKSQQNIASNNKLSPPYNKQKSLNSIEYKKQSSFKSIGQQNNQLQQQSSLKSIEQQNYNNNNLSDLPSNYRIIKTSSNYYRHTNEPSISISNIENNTSQQQYQRQQSLQSYQQSQQQKPQYINSNIQTKNNNLDSQPINIYSEFVHSPQNNNTYQQQNQQFQSYQLKSQNSQKEIIQNSQHQLSEDKSTQTNLNLEDKKNIAQSPKINQFQPMQQQSQQQQSVSAYICKKYQSPQRSNKNKEQKSNNHFLSKKSLQSSEQVAVGSDVATADDLSSMINKECDILTQQLMEKFFPKTHSKY